MTKLDRALTRWLLPSARVTGSWCHTKKNQRGTAGWGSLIREAQPGSGRAGLEPRLLFLFFVFFAQALCIMLDLIEGKCEL